MDETYEEMKDRFSTQRAEALERCYQTIDTLRARVSELEAEVVRLTTCPVCERRDPDGLEACSTCYSHHFQRSVRAEKAEARPDVARKPGGLAAVIDRQIAEIEQLRADLKAASKMCAKHATAYARADTLQAALDAVREYDPASAITAHVSTYYGDHGTTDESWEALCKLADELRALTSGGTGGSATASEGGEG